MLLDYAASSEVSIHNSYRGFQLTWNIPLGKRPYLDRARSNLWLASPPAPSPLNQLRDEANLTSGIVVCLSSVFFFLHLCSVIYTSAGWCIVIPPYPPSARTLPNPLTLVGFLAGSYKRQMHIGNQISPASRRRNEETANTRESLT